ISPLSLHDALPIYDGKPAFGGPCAQPLPEAERRRVLVEVLPWLRGRVSREATNVPGGALRQIATVEMRDEVLEFVNSRDAQRLAELGTSCPDHFLRTKIKPLCVDWDPQAEDAGALKIKLEAGLAQYRRDYAQYYAKHKRADSPAMRRSSPSVILIPGIGLVAWGQSKSEARVTAEFYGAAIGVMRGAERVSHYTALDRRRRSTLSTGCSRTRSSNGCQQSSPSTARSRWSSARAVESGGRWFASSSARAPPWRRSICTANTRRRPPRRHNRRWGWASVWPGLASPARVRWSAWAPTSPIAQPCGARSKRSSSPTGVWTTSSSPPATTRAPTNRGASPIRNGRRRSRSTSRARSSSPTKPGGCGRRKERGSKAAW